LRKGAKEGEQALRERAERAEQARVDQLSRGGAQSQQGLSANCVPR
jgi:hypothetical protein